MEWHIKSAFENSAEAEEVIEAIGSGPATVSERFARIALEYYDQSK